MTKHSLNDIRAFSEAENFRNRFKPIKMENFMTFVVTEQPKRVQQAKRIKKSVFDFRKS